MLLQGTVKTLFDKICCDFEKQAIRDIRRNIVSDSDIRRKYPFSEIGYWNEENLNIFGTLNNEYRRQIESLCGQEITKEEFKVRLLKMCIERYEELKQRS